MFKISEMLLNLQELQLENFKCFKSSKKIKFSKLTILTGANSSGKSSILHAISGVVQSSEIPFKFSPNGSYVNMGDFNEVSNRHDPSKIIKIDLKFWANEEKKTYSLHTSWKRNDDNHLPELNSFHFSSDYFSLKIEDNDGFKLNFNYDSHKDTTAGAANSKSMIEKSVLSYSMDLANLKKDKPVDEKKELNQFRKILTKFFKNSTVRNFKLPDADNIKSVRKAVDKRNNLRLNIILDVLIARFMGNFDRTFNLISSFRHFPNRTYLEISRDNPKIDKYGDGYLDQIIACNCFLDILLPCHQNNSPVT